MRALLTGAGNMGRAIRSALEARGDVAVAMLGRGDRPDPGVLAPVDVAFEFSHAQALIANARYAAAAGVRNLVIGTTGWAHEAGVQTDLQRLTTESGLRVVVGPTFSIGVVLFAEVAEEAARRFGGFSDYDPYVFEWHRRAKADRPSGTAVALADRLLPHLRSKRQALLAAGSGAPDPETLEVVALRAGASPGMHVVGFDAPGESIELRITARDRSAYVAGALLAADRLLADPDRTPGVTTFDCLLREIRSEGDDR
jgi:4-hydroxy-tetrahydrodipicolinate reductase